MIDINKKYRTRDGREVRIYAVHNSGEYPVHGAYLDTDGVWEAGTWTDQGSSYSNYSKHILDLIEVREKKKLCRWINIYPKEADNIHVWNAYLSKEKANQGAGRDRIACKYIEIEYEEGEGL